MKYFDVELAREVSRMSHYGQYDKGGAPYFGHPEAVAKLVAEVGGGDLAICVAYLHDVVEDTAMDIAVLREKMGNEIADAVDALSRREGETLKSYIGRVKKNRVACLVKLADLTHNSQLSRLGREPTKADLARVARYERTREEIAKVLFS